MSVVLEVTLPAQPASGTVEFLPLGGDGRTAPHSMFLVDIQGTGDATGNHLRLTINRDQRFEQLCSYMMLQNGSAAAVDYRMQVLTAGAARQINVGATKHATIDVTFTVASIIWAPPAYMLGDQWQMATANVDTIVSRLKVLLYNFDIQASKKTPLPLLLASLPRSPSAV